MSVNETRGRELIPPLFFLTFSPVVVAADGPHLQAFESLGITGLAVRPWGFSSWAELALPSCEVINLSPQRMLMV